jgi:hypothetical protein
MTNKNSTLVKALIAAAAALSLAGAAQAQNKAVVVEKLPMVVVSGKSVQAQARAEAQRVVLLPRVVVEGRSLAAQQRDTLLASAKPAVCNC